MAAQQQLYDRTAEDLGNLVGLEHVNLRINNFWKALANDPPTLRRTWQSVKEVMAPGALDPLTKELIYLAVSASNGCAYCIASHGAAAKKHGMTPEMLGELMAIVGMANETNSLANGYRVPVDERFEKLF